MLTKESVFNEQFDLNFNHPNKDKQLQKKIHNQLQYRKGFTGNSFLK